MQSDNQRDDRDGDGKYDKSTVFLDQLQMPRAVAVAHGGVLVAEPPVIWFCRDTNGDLKCDEKIEVFHGYGTQGPVEHTDNGLARNLDNWLYNAKSAKRLKLVMEAGKPRLIMEENVSRGQWGIAQDNFGRLYHNSNSSYLHVDLTPAEYLRRNPHFPIKTGVGKGIASGYAPLGAVLVAPHIAEAIEKGSGSFEHGFTYQAHPVSMAASHAVLDYIEQHNLFSRVTPAGEELMATLAPLRQHRIVGDIRGKGLLLGIELVQDASTKAPFPASTNVADRFFDAAFAEGVATYPIRGCADGERGDHTLLAPPFTISSAEMRELAAALRRAVARVESAV